MLALLRWDERVREGVRVRIGVLSDLHRPVGTGRQAGHARSGHERWASERLMWVGCFLALWECTEAGVVLAVRVARDVRVRMHQGMHQEATHVRRVSPYAGVVAAETVHVADAAGRTCGRQRADGKRSTSLSVKVGQRNTLLKQGISLLFA